MDFGGLFIKIIAPIVSLFVGILKWFAITVFVAVVFLLFVFFIWYGVNPFNLNVDALKKPYMKFKYYDLLRWLIVDFLTRKNGKNEFKEYGFTFFVGRQGSGKTMSMVYYLERMKSIYPDCVIVTNFEYYLSDFIMTDWNDLLNIRNGEDGVIFAIDEIHSEYSSANSRNIPESLLSEISQQRKQRVKIVGTAQFFSRVAKPLREQAFSVVQCENLFGRLMRCREYDALQYTMVIDNPNAIKKKLRPLRKYSYVASDSLRECYDTYEKIERMRKITSAQDGLVLFKEEVTT